MRKSIYTVEQIDALLSGKGMSFLGQYATTDAVPSPVDGGHYLIGTLVPYDVYTYVNGTWVNAGPFQGPQGEKGDPGDPFTYEDFTDEQLDALESGAKAAQAAAEKAAQTAEGAAQTAEKAAQTAAEQAVVDAENALQSYVVSAESAKNDAQTAAQNAAEEAAEVAASEAVQRVESKMAGYVSDAEQAKVTAQGAAEAAAKDAVVEVETEMASYVSAAEEAAEAAEAARDAAQNIVGGDFATKNEAQGYASVAEANANNYTDQKIAVIPTPDVSGQIDDHDNSPAAHSNLLAGYAKLKSPNDFLHNNNEYTFIPDGHTGELYINYRTASGKTNGGISNYHFCNGAGAETTVIANYFKGKFQGSGERPEYNGGTVAMLSDVHGRVSKTGDTMTGNLTIELPSYPNITTKNTTIDSQFTISEADDGTAIIQNQSDMSGANNFATLYLKKADVGLANVLSLGVQKDGAWSGATIIHTGNKWLIAPADIGAAEAGHSQAASTVTAGTFAGQVVANGSGQNPGTSLLRNSKLTSADTNPAVNGEICWTYG